MHHAMELEQAHRPREAPRGRPLFHQRLRELAASQSAPEDVPVDGGPAFLSAMFESLHVKRDAALQAARECGDAAELDAKVAEESDDEASGGGEGDAPPRDFSLVITGVGDVCKLFDFLVAAAGVRLEGGVTRVTSQDPPAFTETVQPGSNAVPALQLPLHMTANAQPAESGFKVRRTRGAAWALSN